VELRGRLSNSQVLEAVALAAQAVDGVKIEAGQVPSPPRAPRRWRLVDRLGEHIILQLLQDRRGGLTKQALADRYDVSLSSIKRILRTN